MSLMPGLLAKTFRPDKRLHLAAGGWHDARRRSHVMQPADLVAHCAAVLDAAAALHDATRHAVAGLAGTPDQLETHQLAAHGLAWQATYVETLRQTLAWARRLPALGPAEAAILQLGFAEYGQQLAGGIAMSQAETIRPADMDVPPEALARYQATPALAVLSARPALEAARLALLAELSEGRFGALGLDDDALDMMRAQFQRLAAAEIAPHAQSWHAGDRLIPLSLIEQLAGLGVFGLTVPEEHGGLGLGKIAMCLVSETLSAASLGVGSLGTRAEIAAELIRLGGTEAQKRRWLPAIASGAILPTAVFTEPDTGSDLANLRTRAVRDGDTWRVHGAKTWITHGARSDLMTLLVRTGGPGHRGLSMFLAEKPRGTEADPFPAPGMSGSEIPVLGYRGMKEYEISFDGFAVPADALLGAAEGQGFRQLMQTFESARIQTAARALGVAQNALELGLGYAGARRQFGRPIAAFPRVHGKLAMMAAETMMARQLTYFAARQKDSGRRCDIEAGMAKLLAARIAFANADAALQIHGGNGYALESPISRVLCDARILSIFEGAAEIQAQVIARGLLGRAN
jgi:(2S)-methylsuccinyl-CoA dehydrogenase